MNEETQSKDQRVIPLTEDQYLELERAMQWPEDLKAYDQSRKPTNFSLILGNLTTI